MHSIKLSFDETLLTSRNRIQNKGHRRYTVHTRKNALCTYNDERYILNDGINTPAYGYYNIKSLKCCRFVSAMLDPDELDERVPHLIINDDPPDTQVERTEEFLVQKNVTIAIPVASTFVRTYWSGASPSYLPSECTLYCPTRLSTRLSTDYDTRTVDVPQSKNFLMSSYKADCSKPYSYLLIGLRADTPNHIRLPGRIFNEDSQDVYVQNDYEWEGYNADSSVD